MSSTQKVIGGIVLVAVIIYGFNYVNNRQSDSTLNDTTPPKNLSQTTPKGDVEVKDTDEVIQDVMLHEEDIKNGGLNNFYS